MKTKDNLSKTLLLDTKLFIIMVSWIWISLNYYIQSTQEAARSQTKDLFKCNIQTIL